MRKISAKIHGMAAKPSAQYWAGEKYP